MFDGFGFGPTANARACAQSTISRWNRDGSTGTSVSADNAVGTFRYLTLRLSVLDTGNTFTVVSSSQNWVGVPTVPIVGFDSIRFKVSIPDNLREVVVSTTYRI